MEKIKLVEDPADIQLNEDRDNIQKILGNPPGWALRWGNTAVLVFAILFLLLAWVIKYPDIIPARVKVMTENPPIRLFARSDGQIDKLYVREQQVVRKGELLAILKNPAEYDAVNGLLTWMEAEEKEIEAGLPPRHDLPGGLNLGDLQLSYAALEETIKDYEHFLSQQDSYQKIKVVRERIRYLEDLNGTLENEAVILDSLILLANMDLKRKKSLGSQEIESAFEVEKARANYLQMRREKERLPGDVLRNKLQKKDLEAQIITLRQERIDGNSAKALAVQRAFLELKGQLEQWKQNYLIYAPIDGRITLPTFWKEEQFVEANQMLMAVVPEQGSDDIIAKGQIAMAGSGKLELGMTAHIQLDAYPFQKYGIVKGTLEDIALVPENEEYQVTLQLPDTLITAYRDTLVFNQELSATAEIVTEDRRILVRLFDKIWNLLKNR